MRRLKTPDAFKFMRLIKESGTRDEFIRIVLLVREHPDFPKDKIAAEFFMGMLSGMSNEKAEKRFYEFVSGILEVNVDELMDMELMDFIKLLASYKEVEKVENWKAFFDFVVNLIQKDK